MCTQVNSKCPQSIFRLGNVSSCHCRMKSEYAGHAILVQFSTIYEFPCPGQSWYLMSACIMNMKLEAQFKSEAINTISV